MTLPLFGKSISGKDSGVDQLVALRLFRAFTLLVSKISAGVLHLIVEE
jgi:hypothetical protein